MSPQQILTEFKFKATEKVAQPHNLCGLPTNCLSWVRKRDFLFVKFFVQEVTCNYIDVTKGRIFFEPKMKGIPRMRCLVASYDLLLGQNSRDFISNKLNQVGVPRSFQWRIMHRIRSAAARGNPQMTIRFDMVIVSAQKLDQITFGLLVKLVSLSEKSVKMIDLEEVKMNERDWSSDDTCPICCEFFFTTPEKEVKRLPCSHFYHGSCIIDWLEEKNLCPMRRYEMPTERDFTIFTNDDINKADPFDNAFAF